MKGYDVYWVCMNHPFYSHIPLTSLPRTGRLNRYFAPAGVAPATLRDRGFKKRKAHDL